MASIRLDGFEKRRPHVTANNPNPTIVPEDEFTYKDIKYDLTFKTDRSNASDGTSVNTSDLEDLRDEHDIKQALINIFNTMPGQKVLNPYFGLDLRHYCFDPVTNVTADHIARTILIEAPSQDSRINIVSLSVIGFIDLQQYQIEFTLQIDDIDSTLLNIKGILNSDGFTL